MGTQPGGGRGGTGVTTLCLLVVASLTFGLAGALPSYASHDASADPLPEYSGDEFAALYAAAALPGLTSGDPTPPITGDADLDAAIRAIARERGYRPRPVAAGELVAIDGRLLQPAAAEAWEALVADARSHGIRLRLVSGHRDVADQRALFLGRLAGTDPASIDRVLRRAAAPGFSKHHSGYAIDIAQPGASTFGASAAFRWISADNYAAAKRHGFVPSYPADGLGQGPDPEPWEYAYVGVDMLRCGGFGLGMETGLSAANPTGTLDDLTLCPDLPLSRGAAAFYLVRALGLSPPDAEAASTDGDTFAADVGRLGSVGITLSCGSPEDGCTDRSVTRREVAMVVAGAAGGLGSPRGVVAAGRALACSTAPERICPGEPVTRSGLGDLLIWARDSEALAVTAEWPVGTGDVTVLADTGRPVDAD